MPKFNYVALVIGAGFAIAGGYSTSNALDFIKSSATAEGVVIETTFGPHHPEIAFTTLSGEQIKFSGNGFITQHIGDRVRVRYLPDNPRPSAQIDKFGSIWDDAATWWGMALLWIVAGLRNVRFKGWGRQK